MFYSFIIPLFVFPTYPKNEWQYEIYQYITKIMHVTIGTKVLPFLRFLQPLYNHSHVYCWLCYMLFLLENMELIKLIKRKSINSFSKPNLNLQKIPLVRKASS